MLLYVFFYFLFLSFLVVPLCVSLQGHPAARYNTSCSSCDYSIVLQDIVTCLLLFSRIEGVLRPTEREEKLALCSSFLWKKKNNLAQTDYFLFVPNRLTTVVVAALDVRMEDIVHPAEPRWEKSCSVSLTDISHKHYITTRSLILSQFTSLVA